MIRLGSFVAGLALVGVSLGVVWGDERDQLCRPGYATSVRPSLEVSQRLKLALCSQHHIADCHHGWILDHIIPLELGGDPVADSNLQLQTFAAAHAKDLVENETRRQYCAGKITLEQAQSRFHRD
jgi:hypothetical protein